LAPRAIVVPNGIKSRFFDPADDGTAFRDRHLAAFSGPVVLFLGRVSSVKGIDTLIRALPLIELPELRLVIAGPDEEGLTKGLRRLASSEGVGERVVFTGMLDHRQRGAAFGAASLFVMPSRMESFGNVVLEAMAAGVPAVISPGVPLATEIARAGAGIVCERDPRPLAETIAAVLDDPSLRGRLGARGREFASRFEWSGVAPELLAVYRTVAEDRLARIPLERA